MILVSQCLTGDFCRWDGGTNLIPEIKTLIDDLLKLDNPYHCPHGRPTMISFSEYELAKKFKRIV